MQVLGAGRVTLVRPFAPDQAAPVPLVPPAPPSPPAPERPAAAPHAGDDSGEHVASPWDRVVVEPAGASFEPRAVSPRTYRPDTVIDAFATPDFVVRAASVRGYGHRADGTPRQDEFAVAYHEPTGAIVVAVADGVSAAPLSHLGAALAVRQASVAVLDALDAAEAVDWRQVVHAAAWALVDHMTQRLGTAPDADRNEAAAEAERQLATALVVAVVRPTPDGIDAAVVAVGDCIAVSLSGRTYRHLVGGKAVDGPTIRSAVECLPRVPVDVAVSEFLCEHDEVVMIGSDGFGDPLGDGDGAVGALFADSLSAPPPALRFAHLLDFSRETFDDDRTLVALWRRPAQ